MLRIRFLSDSSFDSTTCSGYGFITILYVFITYGLLYKYLVKPYLLGAIKVYIWSPVVSVLYRIK